MTKTFNHPIEVGPEHLDELHHVNNIYYVQWIQDTAGAHWLNTAPEHIKNEIYWVVRRHEIDYLKPAFAGDQLTGHTWVKEMGGVKSLRRVDILRNDEVLCSAQTLWICVGRSDMKPRRISDELAGLFL